MFKKILPFICTVLIISACKKKTENFQAEPVAAYFPIAVGNHTDYNLDSTLFINFGKKDTVVHYQVRDIVEEQVTDNLDRPAFRIVRYLRKDETEAWRASLTYFVVPSEQHIELIENNLRYIKLAAPVVQDFSWKGNRYIDTYSTDLDLNYLDDWDYIYDSVGVPLTINNISFDNTIKVFERDEFLGQDPATPGTQYAEKNFAFEKYAKGVGLIYREFLHWEYQGAQPGREAYYEGYGVRLTIANHQ